MRSHRHFPLICRKAVSVMIFIILFPLALPLATWLVLTYHLI
jgi:hypothetical protein